MGAACSGDGTQDNVAKKANQVQEAISAVNEDKHNAFKILLLGTGECGKSTILRQLQILYSDGFTKKNRLEFKDAIAMNALESIQSLLHKCMVVGADSPFAVPDSEKESAEQLVTSAWMFGEGPELGAMIIKFWEMEWVHRCFLEGDVILLDSAKYFLDKTAEIFTEDYVPEDQDILQMRQQTRGITCKHFMMDTMSVKMYDVGGQRGMRQHWIDCFSDVGAIMFIASLAEYDQFLMEDSSVNRLNETLDVFESLINLRKFRKCPVFLFLNKEDIFKEKVVRIDIKKYHSKYKGGLNYDEGLKFIGEEFAARKKGKDSGLYKHVTTATNTESVQFVWKAVKSVILQRKMVRGGLL